MVDTRDKLSIRCIEFGDFDCNWEGHAYDEEELLDKVEQHGREKHNWTSFSDETKRKAQEAMRKKAA